MTDKGRVAYDQAHANFKQGYNCAQSVLLAVGGALQEELPGEMIEATAGFSGGIGFSGDVCGAVNGAVLAIGIFLSRKGVRAKAIPRVSAEFARWFAQEYGTTNCHTLRAGRSFGSTRDLCARVTAATARQVVETVEGK